MTGEKKTCTAHAGGLSRGIACDRESGHPGLHRDNTINAYWMPGAPHLECVELPEGV